MMKKSMAAASVLGLFAVLPTARAQTAPSPVTGLWLDQPGKGAVDIEPCGAKLCGRIVWLKAPLDEAGNPKTDRHNVQSSQQSRPLCGLPVLWDFQPDGADAWSEGRIYDPEKGETYRCNLHLQPDGTLHVRGYLGISLLGRTETWTRPAGRLPPCTAPAQQSTPPR